MIFEYERYEITKTKYVPYFLQKKNKIETNNFVRVKANLILLFFFTFIR